MSCSEWKEYRLDEVGDIVSGGTPSTKNEDYYGNEIPWITPKDLSGYYSKYISKGERSITKLGLEKSSAKLLPKGTILFSSRAPIGYVAIAQEDLCTNQGFKNIVCNPQVAHNEFIYYRMKLAKEELESVAGGSTFKEVSGKVMKEFKVKLPSIEEQKRIASILSSLDDKIELNNEMNKTLEEMAQSIFKRWFVDFEFPNEDGMPYKSSGGEMVESELGMIPKGWEVKTIEEISTTVSKGTTPTKKDMDSAENENNINFIKVKDIDDYGEICLDNLEKIPESVHNGKLKRSILYEKDILFSIAGTIGRVTAIDKTLNNSNMNQAIAFIRLKDCRNMFNFIFYLLKSEKTQNDIKSNIVQAVQANVSLGVLKAIKFVQPSKEILDKYNNIAMNIYDKQQNIRYENNDLKIIRDNLLPKLMSGEIILDKKIIIY